MPRRPTCQAPVRLESEARCGRRVIPGSIYCLAHEHLFARLQSAGGPLSAGLGEAARALGLSKRTVGVLADVVEGFFVAHANRRSVFSGSSTGAKASPRRAPMVSRPAVPDHYKTLGVPPSADARAIRKAYRRLVLKHHPDRGGSSANFRGIVEAYRVLRSPSSRRAYDTQRT